MLRTRSVKSSNWTARAVRIVIAGALGWLTALSSNFPPVISGLFLILIPFVFIGFVFLMEFVPAWRSNFDSTKRQRFLRVLFVFAIFLLIYVLITLRQLEGAFGGNAHLWLFAIYLVLFAACAELFKVSYGSRKS